MTDAQLRASLAKWRAALARRDADLVATRRHERWLTRQRAKAKAMIARRSKQLAGDLDRMRCVRYALSFVGTVEHPAGSNGGPRIDEWQHRFGMAHQPWCGAYVGAMIEHLGVDMSARVVYTPYIKADAQAKRNGFAKWFTDPAEAQGGDLALFDFPDSVLGIQHVGIVRHKPTKRGVVPTVEGNTSSGNSGSQDNGGGVFTRERPTQYIVGFARPKWKDGK